jgi:hypothetical protein
MDTQLGTVIEARKEAVWLPRRVIVAVAASFTQTDQDYVDAALDLALRPSDQVHVLAGDSARRVHAYMAARGLSKPGLLSVREAAVHTDLGVVIWDPSMEKDNSCHGACREVLLNSEEFKTPLHSAYGRPQRRS